MDSFLEALVAGSVRINPDGWQGKTYWVRLRSPEGYLTSFGETLQRYVHADEATKDQMAVDLFSEIVAARLNGFVTGEITNKRDVDTMVRENQRLRADMAKLIEAISHSTPGLEESKAYG